jgi:hypothetical protein
VAVPAAQALNRAHALALQCLLADASDPSTRSVLEITALKIEVMEAADSGEVPLARDQIVGTYVAQGNPGPPVTLLEKDGKLIQQIPGRADVVLLPLKGNRYQREGCSDGYVTSVRMKDGKVRLLLENPYGPPTLREKQ